MFSVLTTLLGMPFVPMATGSVRAPLVFNSSGPLEVGSPGLCGGGRLQAELFPSLSF
jgi:hypothetical protein